MLRTLLIAAVAVGTFATDVTAQGLSKLGVGGRYTYVRNIEAEHNVNMGGVFGRLRATTFAVEAAVDYRNEDLGGGFDLKSWPVTASLLIYPLPQVYGLAGLGWYHATLEAPDVLDFEETTDTRLGYHVGAGVEVPVGTELNLVADIRYLFVDHDFRDILDEAGEVEANFLSIGVGAVVYLR